MGKAVLYTALASHAYHTLRQLINEDTERDRRQCISLALTAQVSVSVVALNRRCPPCNGRCPRCLLFAFFRMTVPSTGPGWSKFLKLLVRSVHFFGWTVLSLIEICVYYYITTTTIKRTVPMQSANINWLIYLVSLLDAKIWEYSHVHYQFIN